MVTKAGLKPLIRDEILNRAQVIHEPEKLFLPDINEATAATKTVAFLGVGSIVVHYPNAPQTKQQPQPPRRRWPVGK